MAALFLLLMAVSACGDKKETTSAAPASPAAQTPEINLHTAVATNNLEVIKQHIAAGSNLNERDEHAGGSSPLITAALFGHTEAAKALLDAGADVDFQNKEGSTALHTAAFFCKLDIVKLLLEKGADKTIRNTYNTTAYESVAAPFSEAKPSYEMMDQLIFTPFGMKLDYTFLEKTRPEVAALLK